MRKHPLAWHDKFLAALREVPVLQYACDVVGIDRSTAFRARQEDGEFAGECIDAMEAGIDRAEQEAFHRGVRGWDEPVVYQGQLTPVWARDTHGEMILREVKTGLKDKAGQPIIEQRPVQALDTNGHPVWLTVNKRSDAMLALVLKGRRKQVYAERTEITGADGGPLAHSDETMRAARIVRLVEQAALRKAADELG